MLPAALDEARRLLRHHFGHAEFRPAQVPVIQSVLAGRDTLAVLPTGGGKSVCFQIPALVLGGLTLVVSPLIALMQDQVAAAGARGIAAAALYSALDPPERERIWAALRERSLRLLYVSPERLTRLVPLLREMELLPSLLAVDEAHCIAEWGHDFRPSYRILGASRYRLGRPPAVALTGSATPEVRADIAHALRFMPGRFTEHLGSFDRANLWFGVVPVGNERERIQALVRLLAADDRMVIVYAPTRSVTEAIARALSQAGHRAAPYHAGLSRERRGLTLEAFLEDRLDVIVATCAFGMGIDKPQIRLVVHWTLPPTPEAYYQEAGRAGRDGAPATCIILYRVEDSRVQSYFLGGKYPDVEEAFKIALVLETVPLGETIDMDDLAEKAGVARRKARIVLVLLKRHGMVREYRGGKWERVSDQRLTSVDLSQDLTDYEARRLQDRVKLQTMIRYCQSAQCRTRFILDYFGEDVEPAWECGHCDNCQAFGSGSRSAVGRRTASV